MQRENHTTTARTAMSRGNDKMESAGGRAAYAAARGITSYLSHKAGAA
jgi:hypothetical protein